MKTSSPLTMANLWGQYCSLAGSDDETRTVQGDIRPCWAQFFNAISNLTEKDLARLQQTANRHLREHGASFDVHSEQGATSHPWRLDPVPLLIDHEEWLTIDAGLQQRARLLSLVLADLYGPQDLVRSGKLPADLVLRHRGFLHPCAGSMGNTPSPLLYYAADLARGPDGQMWIVNDRTGIPPGAGYALENRTILAQLFPEEIRTLQVHRLSGYFRALRAGLSSVAPAERVGPRVVFYTPGPYSPSYFEHAYLAAYLGYTLVQGDDLLVRDGQLWLKALEGLQPVDVVMRRVDDPNCDPLELAEGSNLGVPGLLETARNGNVALVNPIGSNVLENPGIMPFLPGLAKELLGEELILPTAATWWCGQPKELQHVLSNFDQLVIKPIDRNPMWMTIDAGQLPTQERKTLADDIQREPWRYIGQERISFSTMPVLEKDKLVPRAVVTRVFAHFDGSGYRSMPGGLTRCGSEGQTYLPTGQLGGICKDTWVLSPEPVFFNSLWLEHDDDVQQAPIAGFFTSHAAEFLFWTGRHAERAACILQTTRVLLENYDQTRTAQTDARNHSVEKLWQGLLSQTGQTPVGSSKKTRKLSPTLINIFELTTHSTKIGGLASVLLGFTNAAYSVRENWSVDTWRIINRMRDRAEALPQNRPPNLNRLQERLAEDQMLLQAFSGLCYESMTRTAGWLFLDIGRRLERAMMVVDLLTATLDRRNEGLTDYLLLEALLEVNESLISYRRAYRTTPERSHVLSLLLMQPKNPKSMIFLLHHLEHQLQVLAEEVHSDPTLELARTIADAGKELTSQSCEALAEPDPSTGKFSNLHRALGNLHTSLQHTFERISHMHFKHVALRPHPLTTTRHPTDHGSTT